MGSGQLRILLLLLLLLLAELLSAKKQENYATTISWVNKGESVFCNFAERAPMPKGIENPEKEELRY